MLSTDTNPRRRYAAAFTLIELLVVIAIIALLVGILLPALAKARNTARLVRSLSSMRQITVAQQTYRAENKDFFPPSIMFYGPRWMTNAYWRNPGSIPGGVPPLQLVNAPWSVGGKFNSTFFQGMGPVDIPPQWRYLTPYTSPESLLTRAEPFNLATDQATPNRENYQFEMWRAPADKRSMWRNWASGGAFNVDGAVSAYDDVGSSFQQNYVWHTLFRLSNNENFAQTVATLDRANAKLRVEGFQPAKFVVMSDQTAWIIINDPQGRQWKSDYGDNMKSVMGFYDGHADYVQMERRPATPDDVNAPLGVGSMRSTKPYDYSFLIPTQ